MSYSQPQPHMSSFCLTFCWCLQAHMSQSCYCHHLSLSAGTTQSYPFFTLIQLYTVLYGKVQINTSICIWFFQPPLELLCCSSVFFFTLHRFTSLTVPTCLLQTLFKLPKPQNQYFQLYFELEIFPTNLQTLMFAIHK